MNYTQPLPTLPLERGGGREGDYDIFVSVTIGTTEIIKYPVRLNRYLALQQICSRREADKLIAAGQIKINGLTAKLGTLVQEGDDVQALNAKKKKLVYYAFHKPKQIITHSPQGTEKSIEDILKTPEKVYPLGRLDKESRGLILLTNDGRLTDLLLNPRYEHEKEYSVKVDKMIDDTFINRLATGVKLDDGYKTKPCQVEKIDDKSFSIILTEGKKRQIRRMCESQSRRVTDLVRTRIMNIGLHHMLPGHFRRIIGPELDVLLKNVGLKK